MTLEPDDRSQFEQATLPHLDAAYNLARWLTQDEHAADDVVQEAYLPHSDTSRASAAATGGPGCWELFAAPRTDWLSKWRGHATVSFDEDFHDQADDSPTPDRDAIAKGEQASVRTAFEQLPPPLREAIVLREIEGLSYQQIATVAEIPIGTVMSRLARGREQLQRRLTSCAEGR